MPEREPARESQLEQLLDSLLFEGYALYPYTPAATKNATPTPFGIVYPPAYAAAKPSTFNHLELRCVLRAEPHAKLLAEVHYLQPAGERHAAAPRRVVLVACALGSLAKEPLRLQTRAPGEAGDTGWAELRVQAVGGHEWNVSLRVENRTPCPVGLTRGQALRYSLLSTHPLVRIDHGTFISPLESECTSVNTFPVLATEADDAILGAAVALPDHPRIAPESRGGMFDSTEIEEALRLHVQALSDSEREEIERQDPAVREMIARAATTTPQELAALHGRVTVAGESRPALTLAPPSEPAGLPDPRSGEDEYELDGVLFRAGARVRIRPAEDADLHARMLAGRVATIERILIDYDGRAHFGLTIDDDPGRELLRETGRLLFFFAGELEVIG